MKAMVKQELFANNVAKTVGVSFDVVRILLRIAQRTRVALQRMRVGGRERMFLIAPILTASFFIAPG